MRNGLRDHNEDAIVLSLIAAASDPAVPSAAAVAATAIAAGSATFGGGSIAQYRRAEIRGRQDAAARVADESSDPDADLYRELVRKADVRGNRAFIMALLAGAAGTATVLGGAALALLFGHPDVGAFTAIAGTVPTALAALLGKLAGSASSDARSAFATLAASREADKRADRLLRVAAEIEDANQRAEFLATKVALLLQESPEHKRDTKGSRGAAARRLKARADARARTDAKSLTAAKSRVDARAVTTQVGKEILEELISAQLARGSDQHTLASQFGRSAFTEELQRDRF